MEKINTDYKRRIWKIKAKLFNMRKPRLSSFKVMLHETIFAKQPMTTERRSLKVADGLFQARSCPSTFRTVDGR